MILILHITGALAFFGAGVASLVNKNKIYKKLMRGFVVFEFLTGSLLAINSGDSLGAYCSKMGIYLAFWMGLEVFSLLKNNVHALVNKN